METKFFSGSYSLGQPYVIISASNLPNDYTAEIIIIFQGFDGRPILQAKRVKHPKMVGFGIDDFIYSEVQVCKNDIYYNILYTEYLEQLKARNFDVNIDLKEVNSSILGLLRDKFPQFLERIRKATSDGNLKTLIQIYQDIVIERNDFDI